MTVLSKPPGRVSFELGPAQAAQYQQPPKMEWWESMFGPSPGVSTYHSYSLHWGVIRGNQYATMQQCRLILT